MALLKLKEEDLEALVEKLLIASNLKELQGKISVDITAALPEKVSAQTITWDDGTITFLLSKLDRDNQICSLAHEIAHKAIEKRVVLKTLEKIFSLLFYFIKEPEMRGVLGEEIFADVIAAKILKKTVPHPLYKLHQKITHSFIERYAPKGCRKIICAFYDLLLLLTYTKSKGRFLLLQTTIFCAN